MPLQCADELGRALARPGQQVVWYTLADSQELRQHVAGGWPGVGAAQVACPKGSVAFATLLSGRRYSRYSAGKWKLSH